MTKLSWELALVCVIRRSSATEYKEGLIILNGVQFTDDVDDN